MNDDINKDLGIVTAYAYAVSKGYTGTEEEFAALMADYAEVGERAEAAATAAAASATAASGSASDSAASATAAAGSSTAASTAAGNASQAATTATTKASEAAQSATAAAGSATTASTKASEAAQSALQAAGSATAAESAKTAAQTAQTAAETAQTAAETAQTAAEDAAESVSASAAQIAQNTADISSVKNALGACIITDTASGAIATFTDGSDGVPMESVTVAMEPIQDLHGQDAPYPGGGGKNKLQVTATTQTKNGVTFTVNSDKSVTASGTATANTELDLNTFDFVGGTSYVLNGCPSGGGTTTYLLSIVGVGFDSGSGYTYTPNDDTSKTIRITVYNGTAINKTFYPMIRLSSVTDATFAPYSNICPISGRSEVGVWRVGKNLFPSSEYWDTGTINPSTGEDLNDPGYWRTTYMIPVVGGTTYIVSLTGTIADPTEFRTFQYDRNGNFLRARSDLTMTLPSDTAYLRFRWNKSYNLENIQLEAGSIATTYEAPDIQHITVQLGQTVYGGTVDAVSGVMTVDREYIALNANGWATETQEGHTLFTSGSVGNRASSGYPQGVCNAFTVKTSYTSIGRNDFSIGINKSRTILRCDTFASVSDVENFINTTGITLCVKLETPLTIQLSEQTLTSLLGTNNVWSDGGNVSVEYVADTKAYIAKVIAAALA